MASKHKRKGGHTILLLVAKDVKNNGFQSIDGIAKRLNCNWLTIKNAVDCLWQLGVIKNKSSLAQRNAWVSGFEKTIELKQGPK